MSIIEDLNIDENQYTDDTVIINTKSYDSNDFDQKITTDDRMTEKSEDLNEINQIYDRHFKIMYYLIAILIIMIIIIGYYVYIKEGALGM